MNSTRLPAAMRPERTWAMRPAIALPLYTGSRSNASSRAAIAIASRTASLSLPYPGGCTASDTSTSPAANAAGRPIMAASSAASSATRAPCRPASRRTHTPYTGTVAPSARRPTRVPAWVSALPEGQTTASKSRPSAPACSRISPAAAT